MSARRRDVDALQTGQLFRPSRIEIPVLLGPYLTFNGHCGAAFKFYERCLGGKIEMMLTHGESPMAQQVPAEWHDRIPSAPFASSENLSTTSSSSPASKKRWRELPAGSHFPID